jgi:hypothetical protein
MTCAGPPTTCPPSTADMYHALGYSSGWPKMFHRRYTVDLLDRRVTRISHLAAHSLRRPLLQLGIGARRRLLSCKVQACVPQRRAATTSLRVQEWAP